MTRWHRDEDGTVVLWLLGLAVLLLAVGGLSLDLWRAYSERRAIAAIADAAATAGASGLDEAAFRASGALTLDPALAAALAERSLAGQGDTRAVTGWQVQPSAASIRVTVRGEVPLTLLKLLTPQVDVLPIEVSAVAEPRLRP